MVTVCDNVRDGLIKELLSQINKRKRPHTVKMAPLEAPDGTAGDPGFWGEHQEQQRPKRKKSEGHMTRQRRSPLTVLPCTRALRSLPGSTP